MITELFLVVAFSTIPINEENRYCYAVSDIPRNAAGYIIRSNTPKNAFRKSHPCPVTGLTTGACPGWAIDHIVPLVCGGCDATDNMQWLPATIKSCAGTECKDRWEQKVYCPK